MSSIRSNPSSRARANPEAYREKLDAICADMRGLGPTNWTENERGDRSAIGVQTPMPFRVACRRAGVSHETVRDAMARHDDVRVMVEAARADGIAVCLEMGMNDTKSGRQWTWLAERIGADELHLPTKVTGVKAEDGGAPVSVERVETLSADERVVRLRAIKEQADAALKALEEAK